MSKIPEITESDKARFMKKTVPMANGCLVWTAMRQPNGYGSFRLGKAMRLAHRVAFMMANGPIPSDHEVAHICNFKACVNPKHLKALSTREHLELDREIRTAGARKGGQLGGRKGGRIRGAQLRSRTHCPQGHEYSGENLYLAKDGRRKCRACWRLRSEIRKKGLRP